MTSEQKETAPSAKRPWWLLPHTRIVLAIGIVALFVGGAIWLWRVYSPAIIERQQGDYLVEIEDVVIPPQPEWIHADVQAEVFRDAGWHDHPPSILDEELTVKVAQAFELHTWVAEVTRVRKRHPPQVDVELTYRQPTAMVEVDYQGQAGLLPVDAEGVLLPPDNFTALEARAFPRIVADHSGPRGPVGTPWGDRRVWAAAKVINVVKPKWQAWDLYRVVALDDPSGLANQEPTCEILTRGGTRIVWGHAPGHESGREPTADAKFAKLEEVFASADGPPATDTVIYLFRHKAPADVRVGGQATTPTR